MMMRSENILILPYNTIKLMDAMLQMEIYNAAQTPLPYGFEVMLYKLVSRRYKELSKYNEGVDQEILDELVKTNFSTYYSLSPNTDLYDILNITLHQKFTDRVTILSPDKKLTDTTYEVNYYDGTIDSLENYIISNGVTCIVCDDMELIKELSDRENVNLNHKSIMVSKMGYNYHIDETLKQPVIDHYYDIKKKYPDMELAIMDLYRFRREVIIEAMEYERKVKEKNE